MNDPLLTAQYTNTADLMELCNNDAWVQDAAHLEDEGQVEAGLLMSQHSRAVSALTQDEMQQLRQMMILQSILFRALRSWMESWNLGAGFEETYTIARRLTRSHLAHLTPAQQVALHQLQQQDIGTGNLSHEVEQQVVAILNGMFTSEDWQAMAEVASHSIASQVLRARQVPPQVTVA